MTTMFTTRWNHTRRRENGHNLAAEKFLALFALLSLVLAAPLSAFAAKKKKDEPQKPPPVIDYSNIVWPNPPAVARIRYQAFYSAEKLSQVDTPKTKKDSWMDRLAGTTAPKPIAAKFSGSWLSPMGWRSIPKATCMSPTRKSAPSLYSTPRLAKYN